MFGQKLPTAEQARRADHCEDAEFDLLPIGMARDTRIGQAQPRLTCLEILQHDGFIGDAAVAGSPLQRFSERVGGGHNVIQQSKVSTVELFSEAKAKEYVVKRLGCRFKKSDLSAGVDALLGIIDCSMVNPTRDKSGSNLMFALRRRSAASRDSPPDAVGKLANCLIDCCVGFRRIVRKQVFGGK